MAGPVARVAPWPVLSDSEDDAAVTWQCRGCAAVYEYNTQRCTPCRQDKREMRAPPAKARQLREVQPGPAGRVRDGAANAPMQPRSQPAAAVMASEQKAGGNGGSGAAAEAATAAGIAATPSHAPVGRDPAATIPPAVVRRPAAAVVAAPAAESDAATAARLQAEFARVDSRMEITQREDDEELAVRMQMDILAAMEATGPWTAAPAATAVSAPTANVSIPAESDIELAMRLQAEFDAEDDGNGNNYDDDDDGEGHSTCPAHDPADDEEHAIHLQLVAMGALLQGAAAAPHIADAIDPAPHVVPEPQSGMKLAARLQGAGGDALPALTPVGDAAPNDAAIAAALQAEFDQESMCCSRHDEDRMLAALLAEAERDEAAMQAHRIERDRIVAEELQRTLQEVERLAEAEGYARALQLQQSDGTAQKHCRFCQCVFATDGTLHECGKEECIRRGMLHCGHTLPCGHACIGVAKEECHVTVCPSCHAAENRGADAAASDDDDDDDDTLDCPICLCPLTDFPCVQLSCHTNHIAHKACLLVQLSHAALPQPGGKVAFPATFKCPYGCGAFVDHPMLKEEGANGAAQDNSQKLVALFERVGGLALRYAEREKVPLPPAEPQGPQHAASMALRRRAAIEALSIYLCKTCQDPFVGGLYACEAAPGAGEGGGDNNQNPAAAANDAECRSCMLRDSGHACPRHPDGVQIKCDFCCDNAVFHCFGTTYFCNRCHNRSYNTPIRPCPGAAACPLKGRHPQGRTNGYVIGCAMCRDEVQNG